MAVYFIVDHIFDAMILFWKKYFQKEIEVKI